MVAREDGSLCLAAVQLGSLPGQVGANVARHVAAAVHAHALGVRWLVFPELSLCGYEPEVLAGCTITADAQVLAPLRQIARDHTQWITVGAPLPALAGLGTFPAIGALTFCPDGSVQAYRKRHLHPGEEAFASAGTEPGADLRVADWPVALAICADITHASHAQRAADAQARVYAAGVLESPGGYDNDARRMAHYAQRWGLLTLMANHATPTGPYQTGGGSAVWSAHGLLAKAPAQGEYLVWARLESPGRPAAMAGVQPLAL